MIELEPFGLTNGMEKMRPVMLFREKGGEAVLPVWMSPVDAGIALTQHNVQAFAMSPHDVTLKVLGELGIKVTSCRFCEVKGHQQYVELTFSGSRKIKTMRFRADHAISFCLQARVKFYCSRDYLETCREVDAALERLQTSLNLKPGMRRNGHPYLN
jgi:bifunctional DNase/RNase